MRARRLLLHALAGILASTGLAGLGGLAACGGDAGPAPPRASAAPIGPATGTPPPLPQGCQNGIRACMQQRTTPPPTVIDPARAYAAVLHTSRGDITLQLDAKAAPVTVNNFVYLAQNHFYDGLTFHRVEPGFVVQGGDPEGTGRGGPGYKLPDETNPAPWLKGSLAMASSQAGVSGSQFFILLGDAPHLARSGVYNHFGMVTGGQEVVGQIQRGDTIRSIDVQAS